MQDALPHEPHIFPRALLSHYPGFSSCNSHLSPLQHGSVRGEYGEPIFVMDSRKTKKTRSQAGSSKGSDASHTLLAPVPPSRPQYTDRGKSAPLVPQIAQQQQAGPYPSNASRKEGRNSEPTPGTFSPPSSPSKPRPTFSPNSPGGTNEVCTR